MVTAAEQPRVRRAAVWLGAAVSLAAVAVSGVWLGHRMDPTWRLRHSRRQQTAPFAFPEFALHDAGGRAFSSRDLLGRAWLIDFEFRGCAPNRVARDRVVALVDRLQKEARANVGRLSFVIQDSADGVVPAKGDAERIQLAVDPSAVSGIAAQLGLGRTDAEIAAAIVIRPLLFLVDSAARVRGAYDAADDVDLTALARKLAQIAREPLSTPSAAGAVADRLHAEPRSAARRPVFSAVDQDGARVSERDLAGHAWVADFIFTQCTTSCPMLSARFAALRRLIPDPSVRFVSFSVDPEHDSPAILKSYAARWGPFDPRWRLIVPDRQTLQAVAVAFGVVAVGRGSAIVHSDRFVVVDPGGRIVASFDSGGPDGIRRLTDEIHAVTRADPGPTVGAPADGERLFATLGCRGCHVASNLAPDLDGVAGHAVVVRAGWTIIADDAYLRTSILSPSAVVVDGFAPTMPSYQGLINERETTELVSYVRTLGARAGTIHAANTGAGEK